MADSWLIAALGENGQIIQILKQLVELLNWQHDCTLIAISIDDILNPKLT